MSHKTNDQPPSVYDLFMKHSKARVFAGGAATPFLRALTHYAVRDAHARKYAHNR